MPEKPVGEAFREWWAAQHDYAALDPAEALGFNMLAETAWHAATMAERQRAARIAREHRCLSGTHLFHAERPCHDAIAEEIERER